MSEKVTTHLSHEGAVLWITLNAPKGNVIDIEMIGALQKVLDEQAASPELKALIFEGAGTEFSFGASVEDHAPDKVGEMLPAFHRLFHRLAELSLPTVAVVRGRCLGGGLELASYASWIVAGPSAKFGQPEIKLGVFAPVASVLLPWRLGPRIAEQMLLTGHTIDAAKALELGLVDIVDERPEKEVHAHIERELLPLSAEALRYATRIARRGLHRAIREELPEIERIYLEELMATADAQEGIKAFLEKRAPQWKNA